LPQNEPLEEYTTKRVVNRGITYANEPETHYINSNRTIEYNRTNSTIPEPINSPTPTETINNMYKYASAASPRVITASPITISSPSNYTYSNANYTYNTNTGGTRVYGRPTDGGSYQSPSRVIRKEVTVPEEVVESEPKPNL
jgi:hypothetical protein